MTTPAGTTFEPRSLLTQAINEGRQQERFAAEAAAAAAANSLAGGLNGFATASASALSPQPMVKNSSNIASFRNEGKITIREPVNSMSLSAANRDVVLGARKGLFVVDLDTLWEPPRFLAHLTTFQVADIQFNPHPKRSNWVASTSNQKLLVWNLDRPANPRVQSSGRTIYSTTPSVRASRPGMNFSPQTAASGASTLHELAPSPSVSRGSAVEHILHAHTRAITDINWHSMFPDVLASCGIDAWTWVWDLRTPPTKPVQGYSAWNAPCTQIKWNRATPYRLATACDNKVLIWDERKGAIPLCTIEAHESRIYGIDWDRHEVLGHDRLLTCSLDRTVKFWNLALPEAQKAIADRELVTEPESIIETGHPVWRARHLPFGQGVMTLPQRGSNTLCMWAKDKPEAPVAQFEGHTDVVKEYLIRTHGGENKASDDRTFQLITWSKDQTLRLWPITEKDTEAVGHRPGAPIKVLHTRIHAVNKSYRDPPMPDLHSATATVASVMGIAPPTLPRSLMSRGSGNSPYGSPLTGVARSPNQGYGAGPSPRQPSSFTEYHRQTAGNTPTGGTSFPSRSFPRHPARQFEVGSGNIPRSGGLPILDTQMGSSRPRYGSTMSGPRDPRTRDTRLSAQMYSSQEKAASLRRREKEKEKEKARAAQDKTSGYMTLGGAGQGYGYGPRTNMRGFGGVGAERDAAHTNLEWLQRVDITGVGVGRRLSTGGESQDLNDEVSNEVAAEEEDSDFFVQEIAQFSHKLPFAAGIEKIDLAHRSCTICLYGPWAQRRWPVYMRIHFNFPTTYPRKPVEFDLERNNAIIPKWRAKLKSHLSRLTREYANHQQGSLAPVVFFLVGQVPTNDVAAGSQRDGREIEDEEIDRISQSIPHPGFPNVDAEDEGEDGQLDEQSLTSKAMIIMPPRRCGASFGPNGELVVFAPVSNRQPHRMLANFTTLSRASSRSRSQLPRDRTRDGDRAVVEGRFLQSYNALSGAMCSLAQRAREFGGEDDGEQDSDLLQLMTTDFVQRRIHSERNEATATTVAGVSRDSSRRRVNIPSRTGSVAGLHGGLGSGHGFRQTSNRSTVRILNASDFVFKGTRPPLGGRKRSSSMPSSPNPMRRTAAKLGGGGGGQASVAGGSGIAADETDDQAVDDGDDTDTEESHRHASDGEGFVRERRKIGHFRKVNNR
ncbi:hypothetical protein CF326_g5980 [Tilletia indica]|nr:hypothetical protein CF326_g5980 [Tilletia indica]